MLQHTASVILGLFERWSQVTIEDVQLIENNPREDIAQTMLDIHKLVPDVYVLIEDDHSIIGLRYTRKEAAQR